MKHRKILNSHGVRASGTVLFEVVLRWFRPWKILKNSPLFNAFRGYSHAKFGSKQTSDSTLPIIKEKHFKRFRFSYSILR